jgi:cytochrome c oxidase cbb3-type subunit 4
MDIQNIFDSASSAMTVVSFATFVGIMWWAFTPKNRARFQQAAALPFADEDQPGEHKNG